MNLFDLPRLPMSEELVTELAKNSHTRIERIISSGQVSDWYDQSETEFVALLDGNAVIEYDDGKTPVSLTKGDMALPDVVRGAGFFTLFVVNRALEVILGLRHLLRPVQGQSDHWQGSSMS